MFSLAERGAAGLPTPAPGGPLGGLGSSLPVPGDWLGPYRIEQPLAEGGMGAVFRAIQKEPLEREVAVKVIKQGLFGKEVLSRFERERQTLARMEHECIARVLDAGATEQGQPFFVMEYVPGQVLTRYCDQQTLSVEQRLELFRQICHGVHHAHQRGVLHRDLKPGNILVVERDEGPVAKIIDFGIARAVQEDGPEQTLLTREGSLLGTPAYMSPEQALGSDDLDLRSDVFSLGVILYELLTGELPFAPSEQGRPGMLELQRRIVHDEPDRPSTRISKTGEQSTTRAESRRTSVGSLQRRLKGDLDWIVMRALEKQRERRYASAHDLAEEIGRHLRQEPVLAGPPSAAYRFRKFTARNRIAVGAGALAILALIAATVISILSLVEAKESERNEQQARLREERRSYLANMSAAAYALESGNHAEAELRLTECPQDQRGFEWQHLRARMQESERACLATFEGHTDTVFGAVFRPGSDEVVTASADGTIRIWTVSDPEPRLVIDAEPMPAAAELANDGIMGLAVSPDGQYLLSGHLSGLAILRDADDGEELERFEASGRVSGVGFTPDGEEFLVADSLPAPGQGCRIRFFGIDDGLPTRTLIRPGSMGAFSVRFDRDGDQLLEGGRGLVRISDADSGEVVAEHAAEGFVTSLDWNPDGSAVLMAGVAGRSARLLDVDSGEILARFQNQRTDTHAATFVGEAGIVLTGDVRGRIQSWDQSSQTTIRTLLGHGRSVQCLSYDPGGDRLLSGSEDHTARLWDLDAPRAARRLNALPTTVDGTSIRSDGGAFVVVTSRGLLAAFDGDGRPLEQALPFPSWSPGKALKPLPGSWVFDAEWHPTDPQRIAFAYGPRDVPDHRQSGRLLLWDGRTRERRVVETGEQLWTLEFTPDGERVVCVGIFGTVTSVDWNSGEILGTWAHTDDMGVSQIDIDPTGTIGMVITLMKEVILFDVTSGEVVRRIARLDGSIHDAVFSTDGQRIYMTEEQDILVRDARSGVLLDRWQGHRGTIRRLAVSPDGNRVVSCGADQTVRIWDPMDGRTVLTLRDLRGDARAPAFARDGSFLIAGDTEGDVVIWRRELR